MKKNRRLFIALKHAVYIAVLCVSYVLSTSPALPALRPNLVIPMLVSLAMYEEEFAGGLYGALAGLLLDYGAMTVFGINAMLLLLLGCTAGLISLYLLRRSLRSALILTGGVALIQGAVAFFMLYAIRRLPGAGGLLGAAFLPTALLTALFAPLYYWGTGALHRHFEPLCRADWELP